MFSQLLNYCPALVLGTCLVFAGCDLPEVAQRSETRPNDSVESIVARSLRDLESGNESWSDSATIDAVRLVSAPFDEGSNSEDDKDTEANVEEAARTDDPPSDVDEPKKPGKFDEEITVDDIDPDQDAAIEPSASDWENAEMIPTPVAEKEITAEIVPTPHGMPENALVEKRTMRKPPLVPRSRADVIAVQPIKPADTNQSAASGQQSPPLALSVTPVKNPATRVIPATGPAPATGTVEVPSEEVTRIAEAKRNDSTSDISMDSASRLADLSDPKSPDQVVPEALAASRNANANPGIVAGLGGGPIDFKSWPTPKVSLFITGQQHGYIEPCGCTGLDKQKGGVARRMTFVKQLNDQGWDLMPIDAGNLIRRFGRQAEIKFHRSLEALRKMGYVAVGFGPDDVRISVGDLIQEAAAEKPEDMIYASANVVLVDPSLMPAYQIVERKGLKVAITSILDPDALEAPVTDDIMLSPPLAAAKDVIAKIEAEKPDYTVLTYYGDDEAAMKLVQNVAGFDLVVVAGGYGEPTYQPEEIEGSETRMILTGNKGMYVGLVGLYDDAPMKYARVPLTHDFEDAPEMRRLMAEYQFQLRDLGLKNLEIKPIPHPSGREFTGSKACGECHTTAFDIWENSPHFNATESLVHPGERGDVPRHFDPECISCHVTGWNPQNYYPYKTGYLDLEADAHLHGNGCENCHGPGADHAAAESGEAKVSDAVRDQLRAAMQLPLDNAREKCMECHDLDNSPDFHEDGAFDDYWAEVEHYGVD